MEKVILIVTLHYSQGILRQIISVQNLTDLYRRKARNISILRLVRLLLLSVFQDTQKQKKYQLYMNMRGISGTDLLKCL